MMSSCLDLTREDDLNHLCRMLSYLKKLLNTGLLFDPSDPTVVTSKFERRDWTSSRSGYALSEGT